MPVLEFLPTEILRQIISSLDLPELSNLSLVSHFINTLVEPFLYASFGNHWGWLTPSLRAIVTRPALAIHVHSVNFSRWTDHVLAHDSSDSALFSTAAQGLGLVVNGWQLELPDTPWSEDAQALLLLHLLPNIRDMCINGYHSLALYIESTLTLPIERLPLKSLVKFNADEYSQSSTVTLTLLLALSRFPSLREVVVDMEFFDDYTHEPSILVDIIAAAGLWPITHLSLHYGNTGASMLTHILRLPRALTHFSYFDDAQYPRAADTTPLRIALHALRPSLQSLELGGLRALQLQQPGQQTIGSLFDWPALTTLKCSLPALLGTPTTATARLVHVLPLGIRYFQLRRTDKLFRLGPHMAWTVTQMTEQLVEVLRERGLVWLKVETVMGRFTEDGRWVNEYVPEVKRRLAEAASVNGVRVEVM